jgi:hypothetical protein
VRLNDDEIEKIVGTFQRKEAVEDFSKYEKEYRERLQGLLEEIFNPEKSFTQTEIIEKCTYCDFKALCKR